MANFGNELVPDVRTNINLQQLYPRKRATSTNKQRQQQQQQQQHNHDHQQQHRHRHRHQYKQRHKQGHKTGSQTASQTTATAIKAYTNIEQLLIHRSPRGPSRHQPRRRARRCRRRAPDPGSTGQHQRGTRSARPRYGSACCTARGGRRDKTRRRIPMHACIRHSSQ